MSRRSARCCISRRTSRRRSRACCWWRRCRAISPRCCAPPCARCWPSTTSTSPTGTTCAMCRSQRRRVRLRRIHRALVSFLEVIGRGRARRCGVPAVRRRAGRGRSDGAGRASGAAAQPHPDGRADRHPRQSNPGQRACQQQADRLVRAEPDRAGAVPLRRRLPARLSGLRAACRVHEHEHRPPRQERTTSSTISFSRWRGREGQGHQGLSTTSISRCSISPPSSIWRRCGWCSRSTACRTGVLTWRGQPVEPRAIRRTTLLTVEGEKDDICAVGQTLAAHDLCSGLRPYRKRHHMQAGVGHYGVFSGKRWENQIYPLVKNVILSSE